MPKDACMQTVIIRLKTREKETEFRLPVEQIV